MSLADFFKGRTEVVHIRLTRVRGSSPREVGAEMFVAEAGSCGTIGGGQLEYMAIDKARAMLRGGERRFDMDVPLGPEIGQCCGGRVELSLSRMSDARPDARMPEARRRGKPQTRMSIFWAPVMSDARLRLAFRPCRCNCILIDSRAEELALFYRRVEKRRSALPEADIRNAPKGSAFIVLTHDHALDFLLTSEALSRRDAAYVGLIGSATKRAKFATGYCQQSARRPVYDTADLPDRGQRQQRQAARGYRGLRRGRSV